MIMDLIRELLRAVVTSSKAFGVLLLGVKSVGTIRTRRSSLVAVGNAIYNYPSRRIEKFIRRP
jgi:hypothetical protein